MYSVVMKENTNSLVTPGNLNNYTPLHLMSSRLGYKHVVHPAPALINPFNGQKTENVILIHLIRSWPRTVRTEGLSPAGRLRREGGREEGCYWLLVQTHVMTSLD